MAVDNMGDAFSYDGMIWTSQYKPEVKSSGALNSISCLGTAFCMASYNNGGSLRYNGATWSVASELEETQGLTSISCPTASFCMGLNQKGNPWQYKAAVANIVQAHAEEKEATSGAHLFSVASNLSHASYALTGLKPEAVHIDNNNNLWIIDRDSRALYRMPASNRGELKEDLAAKVSMLLDAEQPTSVATDSEGNLYIADRNNNIFIYPAEIYQIPGHYTRPLTSRIITGNDSGLNTPLVLAIDSHDNIWVANQGNHSIEQFASGLIQGRLPEKPMRIITGDRTLLDEPNGLFIDKAGNIWVTNAKSNEIYVFAAEASGNTAPTCIIKSASINNPIGMVLDAQGKIYQANGLITGGNINIFEPVLANCGTITVSPLRTISGTKSSMGQSLNISLGYVL